MTYVIDDGNADGELVLHLHGGFSDSEPLHALLLPRLGDRYRVAAFDRRGHGQTPDTEEPFHLWSMADEAIEVLEQLGGGPAHVVGFSDGGAVSLWLATKRPDLVRSMVLIGTLFDHRALHDDWMDPDNPILHTPYALKAAAMYTTEPSFTVDDLATMTMPVLIVAGDDDCFDVSHAVAMYDALPNAQLAVVPAASHLAVIEKGPLVAQLIDDFLVSGGVASTMLPVRRRAAP
jgi:pimeloyl-ACP methyl ester carboxylesterase